MSTKSKTRTTIELNPGDKERLQKIALELLIVQPTGPNARRAGSISQLMQDIASGEVSVYRPNNQLRRPGIYSITNTVTGRKYIGSTNNIYKRLCTHRNNLISGNGPTRALQQDYDKLGKDSFAFDVVEFVKDSDYDLTEREQFYTTQAFNLPGGCYNREFVAPRKFRKRLIPNDLPKL